MITLCKKTLHTFLGISTDDDATAAHHPLTSTSPSPNGGLIFLAGDCRKPANILESSALKPNSSPLKKDPGGLLLGFFLDETNNNCNGAACNGGGGCSNGGGLSSCTESLGFESSEYQTTEDAIDYDSSKKMDDDDEEEDEDDRGSFWRRKKRNRVRMRGREEVRNRKLPPPLSSLNRNGKSSFFLKPVRANGRLVLTEVKIQRPEIFHASRQDGRLRLRIAGGAAGSDFESESRSNEKQPEPEPEPEPELEPEPEPEPVREETAVTTPVDALDEEEEEEIQEEERGGESEGIWKIPMRGGEGFRRCHEMRNHHYHHHHHHNHLPLWNHQCVTTR